MIFFRSSDRVGHAVTRRTQTGSEGICVPPCVPDSASDCGFKSDAKVRILFCPYSLKSLISSNMLGDICFSNGPVALNGTDLHWVKIGHKQDTLKCAFHRESWKRGLCGPRLRVRNGQVAKKRTWTASDYFRRLLVSDGSSGG